MTRFLVTGAAGLLGRSATRLLVARSERPRVLLRGGETVGPDLEGLVDVCRGDLLDIPSLARATENVDVVLHCAARTGPWGDQREYELTNVAGLKAIAEAAAAAGVRRFVHVSSIAVHGNDVRGSASETGPLKVEPNPYSRSKVAGELLLNEMIARDRAAITIVRPGWIYGPGDANSFGRFTAMVRERRMVMIGSGRNHVPLVYVDDVAEGMLLAAGSDQAAGRTYLLVNDELVTQAEYLGAIAAALDVEPPSRRIPYAAAVAAAAVAENAYRALGRKQAPPLTRFGVQLLGGENRFSIARARRELGFRPRVMLAEGVRRSVDWYLGVQSQAAAALVRSA